MLQIILHNLAVVGRHVMTLSVQYCDLQYCSECVEKGWSPLTNCNDDPGVSRGPHVQCTEQSILLTPQLEGYWQTVCHLPGIQLRDSSGRPMVEFLKIMS